MSHVSVNRKCKIRDLEAVKMAAQNLGLECREDSEYAWWGFSVGDSPIPAGFAANELGHNATLVLSVPKSRHDELVSKNGRQPFELAIVADPLNPGEYVMMYDSYRGGYGLDEFIGAPIQDSDGEIGIAPRFVQHYKMCCDALSATELGDTIAWEEQPDGSWESCTTPARERVYA